MNIPFGQRSRCTPISLALLNIGRAAAGMLAGVTLSLFICSCASTSTPSTWKSPAYQGGPLQKIAVVAYDERPNVRVALENRYVNQFARAGQPAFSTAPAYPDLAQATKNKEVTVASLRTAGADSILITRLADKSSYLSDPKKKYAGHTVAITMSPSDSWDATVVSYSSYHAAPRSDDHDLLLLETSLFELKTSQRVWSGLTEVKVSDTDDKLEIADRFVARVIKAMRKDGLIR